MKKYSIAWNQQKLPEKNLDWILVEEKILNPMESAQ